MMYLKDSYLKEFQTIVKEVNDKNIILEDTIFYPESGGQACDLGSIFNEKEEFKVLSVKKDQGKIIHVVDKEGLKINEKVKCVINWERRYKLMRSHTAAHILSAIFQKETGALVTGNQLTPEKIRIDFDLENPDREKLKKYIEIINEVIKRDLDVSVYELNRDEVEKSNMSKLAKGLPSSIKVLRIVKIGDVDEQPDAGTQVKNTSEIGELEFLDYETRGKNNKRVYIKLKEKK
ncbi:alanyl-tRNA editing protein [Candidatus Pacearchaeota archaeon]|nr:alanyl-tRNA editing protein [Candidatus Pacearchaeota archaeon]